MPNLLRKQVGTVARAIINLQDRAFEQLANRNYRTARRYYLMKLAREDLLTQNPSPILVHQMGKVGSTTILQSLTKAGLKRRIYHTHFMNTVYVNNYEKQHRNEFYTEDRGSLRHIWRSQYLQNRYLASNGTEKWQIITLTRDPVARNVSEFFQHIQVIPNKGGPSEVVSPRYGLKMTLGDDVSQLITRFFDCFEHDQSLTYFDTEFKDFFNVDLYADEFPTVKGYQQYEGSKAQVLLMRMENVDDCAVQALCEFLGIKDLKLIRGNVGSQKVYADLYMRFKNAIEFPDSYLDRMYSSKYCQAFYDDHDIEQFWKKWHSTGSSRVGLS